MRASNRKGRGCRWQSRQEGQEAKSRKNDGEEPNLILAEEPAYAQDDDDEGVDQERQPDAPAVYNFSTDCEKRSDALMESQARNGPPFIVVPNEFENPLQRMPLGPSRARWGCIPPISSLRGMTLPCQRRGHKILAHSLSEMSFSTKVP